MTAPCIVLLYVADPAASARLYAQLLDVEEPDVMAGCATLPLPGGGTLGLRRRHEVEPRATLPGGTEIVLSASSRDAVRQARDAWSKLGLRILQEPVDAAFGYSFAAADPDGHRLRLVMPA